MPVNRAKMKALQEQYGKERGTRVYYAMEQQEKKGKKKRGGRKSATRRAMEG